VVTIDSHHKNITQFTGRFQIADMPQMKQVKAAIGEYHPGADPASGCTQSLHFMRRFDLASRPHHNRWQLVVK
jgi:hypothetical protein